MTRSTSAALAGFFLAGVLLAPCPARASVPAAPTAWVTDANGFLSEGARQTLDGRLASYQRQTGHHVLVWIGKTTGGVPLEDFAVQAFAAWKVGRKGLDDGLVLFVFSDDRELRIEVGYGLEGQVPDASAARIIREAIVPRMRAGDPDGAIAAGVDALTAAIEGRAWTGAPAAGRAPPSRDKRAPGVAQLVLIGLVVVGFLILLVTNPSLAIYLLFTLMSGGRGGGGGGGSYGGGGYSGGGGRSGGGGASGSW